MGEITNQMLLSEIQALGKTNDLTHDHLKEGVELVTAELKEFRDANANSAYNCRRELHGKIERIALKQANMNGRTAVKEVGVEPKTRKTDWLVENWKLIMLISILSAAGGNQILPLLAKLLGIT